MKNRNQESSASIAPEEIDVEGIMEHIREKMQQNRQAAFAQGLKPQDFVFDDFPEEPISGDYDANLYAQLRQVNQPHKILGVQRVMHSSFLNKMPIIGMVWKRIQYEGHTLVMFYVKSLANEVVAYQRYVAGVLNRLVSWSQIKDEEIRLLQEEIAALKQRIATLESET